ncbi:MAG: hypothetical protein DMF47_00800 [Verrucomicrobia bacterium]|nr:MAG: hypothetical protein DMF47_00800 [Verrucomicrobiota bacterium]PYL87765.1 MAG: hypothetical protein DMF17_01490 [Verrucomicrobiota bacterium]
MLIHGKVVLLAFPPLRPSGPNCRANTFLFSQSRQETALRLLQEESVKMAANQEDVFGQRSNHRARS